MWRLTLIATHSSKAWETDGDSVWSESIHNLFCFVFPNNSHLKRDSPFRLREWACFSLHFAFVRTADDLFLNAACRQVDSFNQTLCNFFFLSSSKIPDHILELKHIWNSVFFSRCFHSLIKNSFISRVCTQPSLNLCRNNYSLNQSCLAQIHLIATWWTHKQTHTHTCTNNTYTHTSQTLHSTLSHSAHGPSQAAIFTSFPLIHRCCSLDRNIPAATSPSHYPSWNIRLVSPW